MMARTLAVLVAALFPWTPGLLAWLLYGVPLF